MPTEMKWRPLDPSLLQARLREVQRLLRQAAAVGVAQGAQKVEQAAELAKHIQQERRGGKPSRRYR